MQSRKVPAGSPVRLPAASPEERTRSGSFIQAKGLHATIEGSPLVLAQRYALKAAVGTVPRRGTNGPIEEALPQAGFEDMPAQRAGKESAIPSEARVALSNETGMPDQLKASIENLSGLNLSDVRVHRNSDKPAQLNAQAYAQGKEIHLAPGQEQHLPHEAWHVVQQAQGRVQPTMRAASGVAVNDDARLEREADVMGTKILQRMAAIDDSPHILAQRQVIKGMFGRTVRPMFNAKSLANAPMQSRSIGNLNGVKRGLATRAAHTARPVAQRNPDEERRKADQYIVLIEHKIEQDYEELADNFEQLEFYRWLLATLPPQRVIDIWENGRVKEFIAEVAPSQEKLALSQAYAEPMKAMLEKGIDAEIAHTALLFAFSGELVKEPDKPKLALAAQVALLFRHVSSVLASGVLSPAELRKRKIVHTPSSDTEAHDFISAFDIDLDRNQDEHYEERFKLPGHQSVSPVLERQNDIMQLAERMLNAARKLHPIAIGHISTMKKGLRNEDPVEVFIETVAKDPELMRCLGYMARFDEGGKRALANRAMNSAMVVSSGTSLTSSGAAKYLKKPGLGPRVAELRAPTSIEPENMTQVLLPAFMKGFPLLKRWSVPVIFVGTVTTQVGYYDEASRVEKRLELPIPDFQSAIDTLVKQGVRKMLTHITNV